MNELTRIGILVETDELGVCRDLDLVQLRSLLSDQEDVTVVEAPSWAGNGAASRISDLCREEELARVVVCGPSSVASELPAWVGGENGDRAVPLIHAAVRRLGGGADGGAKLAAPGTALRQVEIAVAKARTQGAIHLADVKAERRVVVVGGNHAAYIMAGALGDAGYPVTLLRTAPPAGCFYPLEDQLVSGARDHRCIEVLEGARNLSVDGCVGAYRLVMNLPSGVCSVDAGAVVVAVDAQTVALAPPAELKNSDRLLSLREYGARLKQGGLGGESVCVWLDRGGPDRRCAGQAALQFALDHARQGASPTVLFNNAPVYGDQGQMLYDEARAAGVRFIRLSESAPRLHLGSEGLRVELTDAVLSDRNLAFTVDRLVLPAKVTPSADHLRLARMLKQPLDGQGYLQPGNVRHWPVGAARRGIYFVGGCHDECDPAGARLEAEAVLASVRAHLPTESVRVRVERVEWNQGKCARCLSCVRACPHGAIHPESRSKGHLMEVLDPACYQCGICTAVCPANALEHGSLRRTQLQRMLEVAALELQGRAPVVAFACSQSAAAAADGVVAAGMTLPPDVVLLDVDCAGLVSVSLLLDALGAGARGVLVLGCHHDNCRSLWGSDLTRNRVEHVHDELRAIGIDPARVRFDALAANESHRLAHLLTQVVADLPAGRVEG